MKRRGQQAHGAYEHQGFAHVPGVEREKPPGGRNPALVPAVFHPLPDPFEDHLGMQHGLPASRQTVVLDSLVIWVSEAEPVRVDDESGPHAGSQGVAVHAHNPGDRPAVGIQRGRAVVRLHLVADAPVLVQPYHAGIVPEDGQAPVLAAQPFPDLLRRPLDVGSVKAVDLVDAGGEDVVLAVFGPRLRDGLEFHIGGVSSESVEVVPDDLQGGYVQGQGPATDFPAVLDPVRDSLSAQPGEFFVVHVQADRVDPLVRHEHDLGCVDPAVHRILLPGLAALHPCPLDQRVVPDRCDPLHLLFGQGSREQDLLRRVNGLAGLEPDVQEVLDGLPGGVAHVVRDAGQESDFDHPVKGLAGQGTEGGFLGEGVCEQVPTALFQQVLAQGLVHLIDLQHPSRGDTDSEIVLDALAKPVPPGIRKVGSECDFDPSAHECLPFTPRHVVRSSLLRS